jgi:uncharacterized membrane protein
MTVPLVKIANQINSSKTVEQSTLIAIYDSHQQAEGAIHQLKEAGFDIQHLSIIGKDFQTNEDVVGYYSTGSRMKTWGKNGAFWGGLWGLIMGGVFFIPGMGPVLVAGPFLSSIVGALEGAVVGGGLSALGAGLYSVGVPKDSVLEYETHLMNGKYLLLAHCSAAELGPIKQVLAPTAHQGMSAHDCCGQGQLT